MRLVNHIYGYEGLKSFVADQKSKKVFYETVKKINNYGHAFMFRDWDSDTSQLGVDW